jgi:hypothetical protein
VFAQVLAEGVVGGDEVPAPAALRDQRLGEAVAERPGVDLIVDVPNSAVALAVSTLAREKNRVFIGSGAGSLPKV